VSLEHSVSRTSTPSASDRYHALDALRGFAMFLGVLLHAAIPYTFIPVPFWPVQDSRRSNIFDGVLLAVHDFRMQLFFLLAGFFGCLLYSRYGFVGTAKHRLKRVALPLVLAMLTIQPALQAVSVYALASANGARSRLTFFGDPVAASESPLEAVEQHFIRGTFLKALIPAHLWFLWFLLLCFAVMLPLAFLGDRLRSSSLGNTWDAGFRWLARSPFRWLILAVLTWPLLLPMTSPAGVDTPLGWVPSVHLLAYYFFFFVIGWNLYRHREVLERFVQSWPWAIAVGNLVVLPLGVTALYLEMKPHKANMEDGAIFHLVALALLGLYTWLSIGGLIGLFLRYLSRERAWVRWMADSSYWCYLASLPPIVLLQFLALPWEIPGPLKFACVSLATIALLLLTYQYGVRYTCIGRLLNGPRRESVRKPSQMGSSKDRELETVQPPTVVPKAPVKRKMDAAN